jgi:hypothetical protein
MRNRLFCLASTALLAVSGAVEAQGPTGPVVAAPTQNWNYINHSSTFTEGALRGQAAVVSAAGEMVYLDSLASVNYAEASRRWIDNSVAATRAIYERRAIREEYLEKYGPKPFAGEARKRALDAYLPKRLSAEDFDPKLNKISWPHVLRQSQYEPIVSNIDQLFAARNVDNSGDGSVTQLQIGKLCHSLRGLLRENISRYSAAQYVDALEFIRSVDLESKSTVLAINNPNQNDEMNVDALNKDALNKDALNKDALNKDAINPSAPDAKRNVALPVNVTSKPAKPAD